jgi:hypothetical protein
MVRCAVSDGVGVPVSSRMASVGKGGHPGIGWPGIGARRGRVPGVVCGVPGGRYDKGTHAPDKVHTTPAMAMAIRYQIAAQERDAAIAERLSELAIW